MTLLLNDNLKKDRRLAFAVVSMVASYSTEYVELITNLLPAVQAQRCQIYKCWHIRRSSVTAVPLSTDCSMLHLRVETGRFSRPRLEPEERICLTCNNGQVEDESHFLLHCDTYQEYRQRLFGFIPNIADFNLLPDTDKLKFLLNDQSIIKQTSRFIVDSYEHRSTII